MGGSTMIEYMCDFGRHFYQAPFVLKAFIIYAMISTLLGSLIGTTLYETLAPYVGTFSIILLFPLGSAFQALYSRKKVEIYMISIYLVINVTYGIFDWNISSGNKFAYNPYLAYHPIRPLFTIALPIVWITLMWGSLYFSNSMRAWLKQEDTIQDSANTDTIAIN